MANKNLYGLDEFENKLDLVNKKAPARIMTYLEKEGTQLKTAYRKRLKKEAFENPKKKKNHLRKSLSIKNVKKVGTNVSKDYENDIKIDYKVAPHYHLVEHGHDIVRDGKVFGRVKGKKYFKKTILDNEKKFEKQRHKLIDEILKDLTT